jgi:pimeloyl-ACP methyl ester carboxylesterase
MRTVTSKDGTKIAYDRWGGGPAVILIGGALTSSLRSFPSFVQLAEQLSTAFTVYTFDRRGRGDSEDTPPYSVDREIEDLEALIGVAGGTSFAHGLSSGAVLAVEAVTRGAALAKLSLFEPPYSEDDEPNPVATAQRIKMIAAGGRSEAVQRFLTGIGLTSGAITQLRQTPEWPRLEAAAHTLPYETAITAGRTLWTKRARAVLVPVLVLDSDVSPKHLRDAATSVCDALPTARRRTVGGGFHDVPAEVLAPILIKFFQET